jgi:hypothetical protein
LREPARNQLFELPLRLPARLGEELLGVVLRQVPGEQEQPGQVNLTRGELVEGLGEPLDQAGHPYSLVGAILGVPEALHAIGEERGAGVVQVQLPTVELCQMARRRPPHADALGADGGREALAKLDDRRPR